MRFCLLALLFSLFIAPSANAQPTADDKAPAAATQSEAAPRTAIVPDEENGVILFFIDGTEMMRLDTQGLHVNGDVDFTGKTGNKPYNEHADNGGADAP